MGAVAALAAVGTGCSDEAQGVADGGITPPPDAAVGPGDTCSAPSGLSPDALLAPIETIVVLMMENRSFDHYLGSMRLLEHRAVDGLRGTEWNPAPDGSRVPVFNLDDYTPADPPHDWGSSHDQWNSGPNDGFVIAHAGTSQNEVMGYHRRDQLPVLYALADQAAVCDRWFASVMGPTWPNRFYLHGATSLGMKTNAPVVGLKSIFQLLDAAGVSNLNYYSDLAFASGGYQKVTGLATIEQFLTDARNGSLPRFSIIDPAFTGQMANDDHPSHDIRLGQTFIATVVSALAQSPQWAKCLFVLTYDEHGGFYDHVSPPTTADATGGFTQLGFRVPSLVVGPFVRRCTVSTQLEHVSVISTLTRKYGLPLLNDRVRVTNDLSACIDPSRFTNPLPPPVLPRSTISWSALANREPSPASIHEELIAAMPRHLDRRHAALETARHVLAEGERLGTVRLVP